MYVPVLYMYKFSWLITNAYRDTCGALQLQLTRFPIFESSADSNDPPAAGHGTRGLIQVEMITKNGTVPMTNR